MFFFVKFVFICFHIYAFARYSFIRLCPLSASFSYTPSSSQVRTVQFFVLPIHSNSPSRLGSAIVNPAIKCWRYHSAVFNSYKRGELYLQHFMAGLTMAEPNLD